MSGYYRVGFVLAMLTLCPPALAQSGIPIRTVEVIRAGSSVPRGQERDREASGKQTGFRVLSLTRDRVRGLMRGGFEMSASANIEGGAPQMDTTMGQAPLAASSEIAVPIWMRSAVSTRNPASDFAFTPGCLATPYRPSGFLLPNIEARRRNAYDAISAAACEVGIPVALFDALILSESGYNPHAVSPKSAYGLAQLMPSTAMQLGVDRFDPIQNLRGGARYLRMQIESFGQTHLALAAYNAGPRRVKGGRIPQIPETQKYVRDVLDRWMRLTGHHRGAFVTPSSGVNPAPPAPPAAPSPVRAAFLHVF